MDFVTNIDVKKEVMCSIIDYYEHVQMNFNKKIKINSNSNFFHELKSENETRLESSGLKDYSFEECKVCRSVFPNKYSLLQHHLNHLTIPLSRLKLYQCHYCQLLFIKKAELDQHMINEHKDKNNIQELKTQANHQCQMCNKTYTYRHWHEHMRTVHGNVKLTCDQCSKSFKCRKYLYRHMQNLHRGIVKLKTFQEFICKQCPKAFKSGDCLNKHVRNCHGEKVRCQFCNSVLKSAVYLSTHIQRVHCDSNKKAKCQICGKQFKSERQVKIHINNMHVQKCCPKCGKMYISKKYYCHVKRCIIGTQNAREDNIGCNYMTADVDIDDSQKSNSNVHDDVNVDHGHINNQPNIINKGVFSATKVINKNNPIYGDDMEDIDVIDIELTRGELLDLVNQVRGDNVSFNRDRMSHELHGVTAGDHNMKGGTVGVISENVNGDSNIQSNEEDIAGHFCKICNKKLKTEDRVKIHMKNAHSKNLPVKCRYCGKFYFNLKYFSVHVRKCSTNEVVMSSNINDIKIENNFEIKIEHSFKVNEWAFETL